MKLLVGSRHRRRAVPLHLRFTLVELLSWTIDPQEMLCRHQDPQPVSETMTEAVSSTVIVSDHLRAAESLLRLAHVVIETLLLLLGHRLHTGTVMVHSHERHQQVLRAVAILHLPFHHQLDHLARLHNHQHSLAAVTQPLLRLRGHEAVVVAALRTILLAISLVPQHVVAHGAQGLAAAVSMAAALHPDLAALVVGQHHLHRPSVALATPPQPPIRVPCASVIICQICQKKFPVVRKPLRFTTRAGCSSLKKMPGDFEK